MAEKGQNLWTRFRQRAEAIEPVHPVDIRSRPLYALILMAAAVELMVLYFSDFTISPNVILKMFFLLVWIALAGLAVRRYGSPKIAGMLEAFALPPIVGALTAVSTVFLTTISYPFADAMLANADKALGFDWLSLFSVYQKYPMVLYLSDWAYSSIYLQLAVVAVALFATDKSGRGWTFMTAWAIASLITVLIYPFFPAAGPYLQYGVTPQDIPGFDVKFPWNTGTTIEGIRDGSIRDLAKAMAGLVSFPSFHFAAAVLFAWGIIPVHWLRYPIILLNIAMGFSTIIIGSHYLVDLFGGAVVAALAICLADKAVRQATPKTTYTNLR
jgi:membrane-associated phospholipid phosphatase